LSIVVLMGRLIGFLFRICQIKVNFAVSKYLGYGILNMVIFQDKNEFVLRK